MSYKYNKTGGSSYFGRGGAGSDEDDNDNDNEDENEKVQGEDSNAEDSNGDDESASVISDDGAPNIDEVDEDEQGADVVEGAESDDDDDDDVVAGAESDGDDDVAVVDENDSDMTDAYDSDEDMESGEIDETKPAKRVPRQRLADASAIMGGPSSAPGIQALLDDTINSDSSDEDVDGEDEPYLQKFNTEIKKNYVVSNHPECVIQNYHEIIALSAVVRDKHNNVIDGLHRTCPYLSKFEKTRVLGQRAMQINAGAPAFVKVPENIVDGYLIAEMELSQKKIPFIIRRPLPNGGSEYWKLSDLEDIVF
jgi:DNA-directed RNA polymerase subunit K/omega